MVRSVGRERDGSKTGNEQNERARILKLVALGQNEGKSSVRLRTTLLPPPTQGNTVHGNMRSFERYAL